MPIVSRRPAARATSSLVPTPSVAAASRRPSAMRNRPAKPPTPSTTSGRDAPRARSRIRSTARPAASRSTPARRYAWFIASDGSGADVAARASRLRGVLEQELAGVLRDRDRVLPVEARPTELSAVLPGRGDHPLEREVAEGIRADVPADLLDRQIRRDELGARRHVDTVEARPPDRRARDARVDLGCARLAQRLDQLP